MSTFPYPKNECNIPSEVARKDIGHDGKPRLVYACPDACWQWHHTQWRAFSLRGTGETFPEPFPQNHNVFTK